ncbi:MAG: hypothetical protein IJW40_11375 [Clostridia bacterium]|nr:hypothetical protein [Clostridia bacterium]
MKKCPRCRAVVRDDYECPFCFETLTYESPVMEDKEYVPFNRYTFVHYLKQLWFPFLSLIICIVRLLTLPRPETGFFTASRIAPLSLVGLVWLASLLSALFRDKPPTYGFRIFTEEYYNLSMGITCYLCGCLAIILSFVIFL